MTDFRHVSVSHRTIDSGEQDFGLIDEKGRKVGIVYTIIQYVSRLREEDDTQRSYWILPFADTVHYLATVTPTRNGQRFGASQYGKHVLVLEDASREVDRRIESTRKRYAKKYPATI